VLLALFGAAGRLVVVDVGAGDCLDEFFLAEGPFEVFQNFLVALMGFGLVG
jgi:hypothetical protein